MPTITTRSRERTEFLADIIITAVEGGVGYWARAYNYTWSDEDPAATKVTLVDYEAAYEVLGVTGMQFDYSWLDPFVEAADKRLEEHTYPVDVDTIAHALSVIRGDGVVQGVGPHARKQIKAADRANDAGDIDADLADLIVQVATLGDAVYG